MPAPDPAPPSRRGRLLRFLGSLPWPDIGVAASVAILGFSQPLFGLILENLDFFPGEVWFHGGVLFWAGILPVAVLWGLDYGVARYSRRGAAFRLWRALLCTILFASLLRQSHVYYPRPFDWALETYLLQFLYFPLLGLVCLLCIRFHEHAGRYLALLGILASLLTASYASRAGILNRPRPSPSKAHATIGAPGGNDDPVYIIVFDELTSDQLMKEGRIDAASFPNFAALAAESAWFPRATTNHLYTKEALPCMLSGKMTRRAAAPRLFDFLAPDVRVVVRTFYSPTYEWARSRTRPGQVLLLRGVQGNPLKEFFQIPYALGELFALTPFPRTPFEASPRRRILPPLLRGGENHLDLAREFEGFLSSVKAGEGLRTLTLWHCQLPHYPFVFNPDGTLHHETSNEFLKPADEKALGKPAGYHLDRVLFNYHRQIQFTDRLLGRFLARLREEGLYDRATVVVTSDHGMRTWGAAEPLDYPERIGGAAGRIPLLIRSRNLLPGPRLVDYQHIDFTPTLLDVLGVTYDPSQFDGVSAFSQPHPPRTPRLHDTYGRPFEFDPKTDLWTPVRAP